MTKESLNVLLNIMLFWSSALMGLGVPKWRILPVSFWFILLLPWPDVTCPAVPLLSQPFRFRYLCLWKNSCLLYAFPNLCVMFWYSARDRKKWDFSLQIPKSVSEEPIFWSCFSAGLWDRERWFSVWASLSAGTSGYMTCPECSHLLLQRLRLQKTFRKWEFWWEVRISMEAKPMWCWSGKLSLNNGLPFLPSVFSGQSKDLRLNRANERTQVASLLLSFLLCFLGLVCLLSPPPQPPWSITGYKMVHWLQTELKSTQHPMFLALWYSTAYEAVDCHIQTFPYKDIYLWGGSRAWLFSENTSK